MRNKIGIIGFGNMGSAVAKQIKLKYPIWVFDKDKNKIKNLVEINIAKNIKDLVKRVDTIILAIKPQDFDTVLNEIKGYIKDKLIISIAAGITTGYIENYFNKVRVIRVMPNMPAKIGKGVSCLCKGKFSTEDDLNSSKQLFENLGKTMILKENMMDAATAISGSGPGYYFDIIESNQENYKKNHDRLLRNFIKSLTDAAESIGFNHKEAVFLADSTGLASDRLLMKTKLPPSELKKQIISKGGTTEAALEVLHKGGSLREAVKAALKRAKELSK